MYFGGGLAGGCGPRGGGTGGGGTCQLLLLAPCVGLARFGVGSGHASDGELPIGGHCATIHQMRQTMVTPSQPIWCTVPLGIDVGVTDMIEWRCGADAHCIPFEHVPHRYSDTVVGRQYPSRWGDPCQWNSHGACCVTFAFLLRSGSAQDARCKRWVRADRLMPNQNHSFDANQ